MITIKFSELMFTELIFV